MAGAETGLFINFTNHPSELWEERQKAEALKYGKIVDVMFPQVDADADTQQVEELAEEYAERIAAMKPKAVLCQGEFCVTYQVVKRLLELGIVVLAACSTRKTMEKIKNDGSTEKTSVYRFVCFREYT